MKYTVYFILAAVLYFVFFHRIDSFYLRTWDESVYAVYSYEMMDRGNYLVPSINGAIDYLNDKPPLFFWTQMLSIKTFGYNELAVRLPSALFGSLTVIMLFVFLSKRFSFWLGLMAALVLCCAKGFVTFHSARTGDMDVMLTFGLTGFVLSFFCYMQDQKTTYLLYYFFFFLFSFFTKSIIVFFFIPAQIIWVLVWKRNILKNWRIWLGIAVSAISIVSFVLIRTKYEPGYFQSHMIDYLLRFKQPFYANHNHPGDFYLNNLFYERFPQYILLLLPALFLVIRETNRKLKQLQLYSWSLLLTFFAILCISPTKCFWYDVPLFPLLAIIVAYFLWKAAVLFSRYQQKEKLMVPFILFAFSLPVYFAIKRSHNNDITEIDMRKLEVVSEYLHNHKKEIAYPSISVSNEQYITPMLFYKYYFEAKKQVAIKIAAADQLRPEEIFITGNDSIKRYITEHYQTEQLETYKNATIYKIKG